MQIFGLGFRGKVMGRMVYSGIYMKKEKGFSSSFLIQGDRY